MILVVNKIKQSNTSNLHLCCTKKCLYWTEVVTKIAVHHGICQQLIIYTHTLRTHTYTNTPGATHLIRYRQTFN